VILQFLYLHRILNIHLLYLKNLIQMNLIFLLLILRMQLSTSFFIYSTVCTVEVAKTVLKMSFRYRANKAIESIMECIGNTAL